MCLFFSMGRETSKSTHVDANGMRWNEKKSEAVTSNDHEKTSLQMDLARSFQFQNII